MLTAIQISLLPEFPDWGSKFNLSRKVSVKTAMTVRLIVDVGLFGVIKRLTRIVAYDVSQIIDWNN